MGQLFKKEGLISSPMEERVRFIYALSQEISQTISNIDGVTSARVHIVLPENDPLSGNLIPSSASVFLKHAPDSVAPGKIAAIKELVVNSIEGLAYDKVSVALFETTLNVETAPPDEERAGNGLMGRLDPIMAGLLATVFLLLALCGWLTLKQRRGNSLEQAHV